MASPLKYFRKNQKKLLVFFGVLIMFSFIVGSAMLKYLDNQSGTRSQSASTVLVTWNQGNKTKRITISEFQKMRRSHDLTDRFLGQIARHTQEKKGAPKARPLRMFPMSDQSILLTVMLANWAEDLGFVVDDAAIQIYLDALCDGKLEQYEMAEIIKRLSNRKNSEREIFDWLRLVMLTDSARNMIDSDMGNLTPAESWEYFKKLKRQVEIEVLQISVADYITMVKGKPSNKQVRSLYEKYKIHFSHPDRPDFGFAQRRKIEFRYAAFDRERFLDDEKLKISKAQVEEYYEKNKDNLFTALSFSDDPPQDEKTSKPAENKDPSTPQDPNKEKPGNTDDPAPKPPAKKDDAPKKPAGEEKSPPAKPKKDDDKSPPASDPKKSPDQGSSLPTDRKFFVSADDPKQSDPEKKDTKTPPANEVKKKNGDAAPDPKSDDPKSDDPKSDDPKSDDPAKKDPKPEPPKKGDIEGEKKTGAEDGKSPKKKKYKPLEIVEDDIRSTLALEAAENNRKEAKKIFSNELQAYLQKYNDWLSRKKLDPKNKNNSHIEKPDPFTFPGLIKQYEEKITQLEQKYSLVADKVKLAELATAYRQSKDAEKLKQVSRLQQAIADAEVLKLVVNGKKMPLLDFLELEKKDANKNFIYPLAAGKSKLDFSNIFRDPRTGRIQLSQPTFIQVAFNPEISLFTPSEIPYRVSENTQLDNGDFIYWKIAEKDQYIPPLKDVRQKVVEAWIELESRKLAEEYARQQVKKARRSGKTLKEFFAGALGDKVVTTVPFAWMSSGNVAMSFSQELTISEVESVDRPGDDFMKAVFDLHEGQIGFAFNNPRNNVYVFRISNDLVSESELLETFLDDSYRPDFNNFNPTLRNLNQLYRNDQQARMQKWYELFEKKMEVKWDLAQ